MFWFVLHQCPNDDDDDFLCEETPKTEGFVGMTPSSYDSNVCSPHSMGSPLMTFQ